MRLQLVLLPLLTFGAFYSLAATEKPVDPICGECAPQVAIKTGSTCFAVGFSFTSQHTEECEEDVSRECFSFDDSLCSADVQVMFDWILGSKSSGTPGQPITIINRPPGQGNLYGVNVEASPGCGGFGDYVRTEQYNGVNGNGQRLCFADVRIVCTDCNEN